MAQLTHPLKILQVIDRLDAGGAERVMVDLSNILFQNGHQVTTIAILDHGDLRNDLNAGIQKIDLNRTGRLSFSYMKRFSREAKKIDVVHVHMRHNLKYVCLIKALFPFKAKIVFHDHYGKINVDQSVSFSLKWALKQAVYIGVSKQLANWAIDTAGLPNDKVFHLSNIIIKKEIDIPDKQQDKGIKLVLVSNIRREKNIELAIQIAKKLLENSQMGLTIYGQVVDQGYYDHLKTMIAGLGMQNEIKFIHDCVDIQPELYQYDLALHTAKSETGPLVLIEYLCQGLPFVSYRTGEVIDQLKDEVPEFIMDSFDEAAWAQKVKEVLRENTGEKLTALYSKHYSAENYYQQCMKIYKKSLIC